MSDKSIAAPTGLARRAFVTALAGGAAAAIVAPAAVLASGEPDPIFALIGAHRTAADAFSKACFEVERRQQILIDEGSGTCPFVAIADSGRPVVAYNHETIDSYSHSSELVRTRAHAALQAAIERNQAVMGDAERVSNSACDADTEAWEELLSTPPTSMAGIRDFLAYILREVDDIHMVLGDSSVAALTSIEDALEALQPSA